MSDSPGLFQEHTLLTRLHAETRALLAVTSDGYRDYEGRGDGQFPLTVRRPVRSGTT